MTINDLLLYAGIATAGWLIRHFNIGLPKSTTSAPPTPAGSPTTAASSSATATPAVATSSPPTGQTPTLVGHPLVNLAWTKFGAQFEALAAQELETLAQKLLPPPAPTSSPPAPAAK